MTVIAAAGVETIDAVERAGDRAQAGWIESRGFDLALFTLSPLSGLVVVLASAATPWGRYLAAAAVYFVAIPHYLSTFTFYLGDDTRAYYRQRWAAFFVGPIVCVAAVFTAIASGQAALFQATQFTWNIYHVALQSAGILGLYRWLNGGPASERRVSVVALGSTAAAMAFLHVDRYPPLQQTLAAVHTSLPALLFPAALAVAVPSVATLAYRIARRPRAIAAPEAAFLATSLLLFHPYLWVGDANLATLAMLMGHFVQYLAVVWLVHRRKYAAPVGSAGQRALARVGARTPVMLTTLAVVGLMFLAADRGSRALGMPGPYQITWNVVVILHFYLDGVIWTFRRPEIRDTIGRFLILPEHRAA
jgi:hypothetical protein